MKYYDISPIVHEGLAVFPGDTPFSRKVELDFAKGDNLVLSSINMSAHLGAHADAPSHYAKKGKAIHERNAELYLGRCQVIWVNAMDGARIRPSDLGGVTITARRVLFRTGTFPNPDQWNNNFVALSPELILWLAESGVQLVGIDTPSIDPADDKELITHSAVFEADMAVLEGIVLDEVPSGEYLLIALPLAIKGGDASPVRAILLPRLEDPWQN